MNFFEISPIAADEHYRRYLRYCLFVDKGYYRAQKSKVDYWRKNGSVAGNKYWEAEQNVITNAYEKAFLSIAPFVEHEALYGSYPFGVATLTHESDIDGVIMLKPQSDVSAADAQFSDILGAAGMTSNVNFCTADGLLNSNTQEKSDAEIYYFYKIITGLITGFNPHISWNGLKPFVLDAFKQKNFNHFWTTRDGIGSSIDDSVKKYIHRLDDYHRKTVTFRTFFQQDEEIAYQ